MFRGTLIFFFINIGYFLSFGAPMWCFVIPATAKLNWGKNQTTSEFYNQGPHGQIMLVSEGCSSSASECVSLQPNMNVGKLSSPGKRSCHQ